MFRQKSIGRQSRFQKAVGTRAPVHLRRLLVALTLVIAVVARLPSAALAAGPGGWDHLGHGSTTAVPALNGAVYALAQDDSGLNLYAGGAFTDAGGRANADHLAKWNGTAWSALSSSALNGNVRAIAVHSGRVIVGGNFTDAGGDSHLDFLAQWDGNSWSSPCNVPGNLPSAVTATVLSLQIIGNTLHIGGSFANGAGLASADFLLACDLTTGTPRSTVGADGDINGSVLALTADSNGVLYAGGSFINVAGIPEADHVASYDGAWHAMGAAGAVDDRVRSLAAAGTAVYVGTDSVDIAGIAQADHVARWNGSFWSGMGSNTSGSDGWFPATSFIDAMAAEGTTIFAAGSFQNANGQAKADQIAYFDGSSWHPLGSDGAGNGPLNSSEVDALAFFHLDIVAGGNFTNAGGDALADDLGSYRLRRPDARIATGSAGPYAGNNVYSGTGVGEAKTIHVPRGGRGVLYVDIQNDGLFSDTFKVHGTGTANGFTVSYFNGATNVTALVAGGTFSTGTLTPGGHLILKMVVKLASTSSSVGTFLIKATGPGEAPDSVKAVVHAA